MNISSFGCVAKVTSEKCVGSCVCAQTEAAYKHCGCASWSEISKWCHSHFNSTVLILGYVCLCVWVVWLDLFLFVFFSERILLMISAKLLFFSEKKRKRGR